MRHASLVLNPTAIGRIVFIHSPDGLPGMDQLDKAGSDWLESHAPEPLALRAVTSTTATPLAVDGFPVEEVPPLHELALARAGVEELACYQRATHALVAIGRTDATLEGWLGVESYARGVATAFDGVIVDWASGDVRPLDDRHAELTEMAPRDVCGSLSIPTTAGRWSFVTTAMRNLGLSELFFDDVGENEVEVAVKVIGALRDGISAKAAEHLRAGKQQEPFRPGLVEVPVLGRVGFDWDTSPWLAHPSLRPFVPRHARKSLGRMLRRRSRAWTRAA